MKRVLSQVEEENLLSDELIQDLAAVAKVSAEAESDSIIHRRLAEARAVIAREPNTMVWHKKSNWAFHFGDCACGFKKPLDIHEEEAWKAVKICKKLPCSRGYGTHKAGLKYAPILEAKPVCEERVKRIKAEAEIREVQEILAKRPHLILSSQDDCDCPNECTCSD